MTTNQPSFAEREEARRERALERADRFEEYANNAGRRSQAAFDRGTELSEHRPPGQPILNGHPSAPRARRDQERISGAMERGVKEDRKSSYWNSRQAGVERNLEKRYDPRVIARRIERLEARLRKIDRDIDDPWNESHRQQLLANRPEAEEELAFWRTQLAEHQEAGVKLYGPDDFNKGDFALISGVWCEIKRVNKKSITIGAIIGMPGRKVYRLSANPYGWTDTMEYSKVMGRKSPGELSG
ncbi:DUF3560 domain-containing protein [Nocardiopsis terrae]